MKTIKNFNSFLNEKKRATVDTPLDEDVLEQYLDVTSHGAEKDDAIAQVASEFGISVNVVKEVVDKAGIKESVSDDEKKYLTVGQRKLPEGLKKGIIAKAKKSKPKADDDCDDCDDKKDDKKSDKKDDKKSDKEDDKKSGSDEEKYLSPKQRKLPEGLKKGIIAKAKKKAKK